MNAVAVFRNQYILHMFSVHSVFLLLPKALLQFCDYQSKRSGEDYFDFERTDLT